MNIKLYNIVSIVNEGYSELVMETAKELGAKGGTIIQAVGSATEEARKLYGIGIQPEKEIVLIIVKDNMVQPILNKLYDKAGNETKAKGIFFTLPVEHASDNIINQYKVIKKDE